MSLSLASAAALFGTMLVLSASPGPSDAVVISRAASGDWRGARAVVLGIILGDVVLIALTGAGWSLLAHWAAQSAGLLQALCALVLLGFAWLQWPRGHVAAVPPPRQGLWAGLLLTVADPRALLFYLALLPAFLDVARAGVADWLVIIALAGAAIALVKFSYALLSHRLGRRLDLAGARLWPARIAALVLALLGLALLFQALRG